MQNLLTIAIPTWNRKDAVVACVKQALDNIDGLRIQLFVSDNASDDGTEIELKKLLTQGQKFKLERNEINLGYTGNLKSLIFGTQTKFIMFISDEDHLVGKNLSKYLEYLERTSPAFCMPKISFSAGDWVDQGSYSRAISPMEFDESTTRISGLTFETEIAKKLWIEMEALCSDTDLFKLYPQSLLNLLVIAYGMQSRFFGRQLVFQAQSLPSDVWYAEVEARKKQIREQSEFFDNLLTAHEEDGELDEVAISKMRRAHEFRSLHTLRSLQSLENPLSLLDRFQLRLWLLGVYWRRLTANNILGVIARLRKAT